MNARLTIPEYQTIEKIYESHHTCIYRGRRLRDNLKVIIKVSAHQKSREHENQRLQREYELGRLVNSPFVIRYIGIQEFESRLAIIEEDFGAVGLHGLAPPGGLEIKRFLQYAIQIAQGLEAIHLRGIIHRDIKPQNLVVHSVSGDLKLIDFGISTRVREEAQEDVSPSRLEGTLAYMSPEQTGRMHRTVDYRTDFYSLGITFYELLCGRLPFNAVEPLEYVHHHIAGEPIPPRELREDIPKSLSEIVLKLMAKSPDERYQSNQGLRADLERVSDVDPGSVFELGTRDLFDHFALPGKIYGRHRELSILRKAFRRLGARGPQTIMLSGAAGVGKTVLAEEISSDVIRRHGYFLSGQFELMHRAEPYTGIVMAFRGLLRRLLGESEVRVGEWRDQLKLALGEQEGVLSKVIPELELLLGPQPPPPELGPVETRNRFQAVFHKMLTVFATENHPIVIFLDDIQWADPASMQLLQNIIHQSRLQYLMVILAWRDNEADDPLLAELERLRRTRYLYEIELPPLGIKALGELIADTLHRDVDEVHELAELTARKTEGNPFFAREFLLDLYRENCLSYNPDKRYWEWSLEKVRRVKASENVLGILTRHLMELPEKTLEVLRVAACLGHRFDLTTLAAVREIELEIVIKALAAAVDDGIIVPMHEVCAVMVSRAMHQSGKAFPAKALHYQFQHERIRQVAYHLIPAVQRPNHHLAIGRALARSLSSKERRDQMPNIVFHLNEGRNLMDNPKERRVLALMNLRLARLSRASGAYVTALNYLDKGLSLLPPDPFKTTYNLAFALHSVYAECMHANGAINEAENASRELMMRARDDADKLKILRMSMVQNAVAGNLSQAIELGLEGLRLLGMFIPKNPSRARLLTEQIRLEIQIKRRGVRSLLEARPLTDPKRKAIVRFLAGLSEPAHHTGNKRLYTLVTIKRLSIAMRFGMSSEAISALLTYANLLGITRNNLNAGRELGRLAMDLNNRFPDPDSQCRVLALYAIYIHGWNAHWQTLSSLYRKTLDSGLTNGDFLFTSYACAFVNQWNPTMNLETACQKEEHYLEILEQFQNESITLLARLLQQYRLNLRAQTQNRFSLSSAGFAEEEVVAQIEARGFKTENAIYHLLKLQIHFNYDDVQGAANYLIHLEHLSEYFRGMLHMVDYRLFSFLTLAALWPDLNEVHRRRTMNFMVKQQQRITVWASHCPMNFLHLRHLVQAEMAAIEDRFREAAALYDKAIETARRNQYPRYEALACEQAGKFFRRLGHPRIALIYLADAWRLYKQWGAHAKVAHLEETYGFELGDLSANSSGENPFSQAGPETIISETSATTIRSATVFTESDAGSQALDLATVAKATQAISSEIDLDRLLLTVLSIIIENAGAQRGFLVMLEETRLMVRAEAGVDGEKVQLARSLPLEECADLSRTIVRYVYRTGEDVVLRDATSDDMFGKEPYIAIHGIRSILCTAIRHKENVIGVLYLENNLTTNAFTQERIRLLHLLLSQAAISLENARLYTSSHNLNQALLREVEERKQVEAKVRSLNEDLEARVEERTRQLEAAQQELVEKAHRAGMADIATSVLHNVGNILNSVITSSQLIASTVKESRLRGSVQAAQLIEENRGNFGHFVDHDPKGQRLVEYFSRLGEIHQKERRVILDNVNRLITKVDSIREVIMYQQNHATMGFQTEEIDLANLVRDALQILGNSLSRHRIEVDTNFKPAPPIYAQKSKLLHIIINLIKNAKEAVDQGDPDERTLGIRIEMCEDDVMLTIRDTGIGIPKENMARIFTHGFTTKPNNHGFGLHGCANHMTEMGGSISAESKGMGKGAAFSLRFPLEIQVQLQPAG